jgi:D-sedoheptulose 7-phosphate isomerase
MLPLKTADDRPLTTSAVTSDYIAYFRGLLDQIDSTAIDAIVRVLRRARDDGATVYIAGNGGSASTAAHLANDLGKATKRSGCPAFRVMCLSDNVSWLTALGNDEGYERVFTGQLENFARAGDVLMVISASGRSPNLVNAVEFARTNGVVTVGLLGFDGGVLRDRVDACLCLETEPGAYGPVETGHSLVCDIITTCLTFDRPSPAVVGL